MKFKFKSWEELVDFAQQHIIPSVEALDTENGVVLLEWFEKRGRLGKLSNEELSELKEAVRK